MSEEQQGMVVRDMRIDTAAFEPSSFDELRRLGELVFKSKLAPHVNSTEAACLIIATGRELGISAMKALRSIHVIDGRPTLSADLMVALVKQATGVCRYFRVAEMTPERCTVETLRVGDPEPTAYTYTIDDAKAAGLTGKQNWRAHPTAMLRARASSTLVRTVYPDIIMGLYDPDENEPAQHQARDYVDAEVVEDRRQGQRDQRQGRRGERQLQHEYLKLADGTSPRQRQAMWAKAAELEQVDFRTINPDAPWTTDERVVRRVMKELRAAAGIVDDGSDDAQAGG